MLSSAKITHSLKNRTQLCQNLLASKQGKPLVINSLWCWPKAFVPQGGWLCPEQGVPHQAWWAQFKSPHQPTQKETQSCATPLLQSYGMNVPYEPLPNLGLQPLPLEAFPFGLSPQCIPLCIQHNLTLNSSGQQ